MFGAGGAAIRQWGKWRSAGTILESESAARRAAIAADRAVGVSCRRVGLRSGRLSASCRNASCCKRAACARFGSDPDALSMTVSERLIASASCAGSARGRVLTVVFLPLPAPQARPATAGRSRRSTSETDHRCDLTRSRKHQGRLVRPLLGSSTPDGNAGRSLASAVRQAHDTPGGSLDGGEACPIAVFNSLELSPDQSPLPWLVPDRNGDHRSARTVSDAQRQTGRRVEATTVEAHERVVGGEGVSESKV